VIFPWMSRLARMVVPGLPHHGSFVDKLREASWTGGTGTLREKRRDEKRGYLRDRRDNPSQIVEVFAGQTG
jgi:hypothetical protein